MRPIGIFIHFTPNQFEMKVFFILFLTFQTLVFSKFVTVSTQNGEVLGKIINGHREFLGIPYAEKPERFRRPVPKRPWFPNVRNATTFGNFLSQFTFRFHLSTRLELGPKNLPKTG
jgi:hypothetical protein